MSSSADGGVKPDASICKPINDFESLFLFLVFAPLLRSEPETQSKPSAEH